MILFIDGSDIARLTLGRASISEAGEWSLLSSIILEARPEGYLAAIDEFVGAETIDSIIAVTGPGSATALRTSLSIVNAISLAKRISLYGIPAPTQSSVTSRPKLSFGRKPETELSSAATLLPNYHHDPVITTSTRDALLRAL